MTRFRPPLAALLLAVPLAMPATARAAVPHTVQPGETLWTIAAQSNLTTRTLAAYNGLPEDGHVILGSTIQIPSESEGAAALAALGASSGTAAATGDGSTTGDGHSHATTESHSHGPAPEPMGSYIVRPGDTLAELAAVAGVPVDAIATMNGLDPARYLLSGTVLKLPTGSPTPPAAEAPAPAATVVPSAAPNPTPGRVTADEIARVASAHGVPGSLAAAIAWQESGFNNSMVSSANARGVMQVMPGTWSWVQENLTDRPLDPDSPSDNVHAGVLYLRQLLDETGGDEDTAIAGYYQGLGSVRSRGFYDDTKRYVSNVHALRSRFGG
jgi:soluble lytic murein transglycosylase-like protein